MNQEIAAILRGENLRSSLAELRRQLKENNESPDQEINREWDQNAEAFLKLFGNPDAKTRKNIVLLTGDLGRTELAGFLYRAYLEETTRFVRSSYLEALLKLYRKAAADEIADKTKKNTDDSADRETQNRQADFEKIFDDLTQQLDRLEKTELTEENRKHIQEEKRLARKLLIAGRGIRRHTFTVPSPLPELLLVTNKNLREQIKRSIKCGQTKMHPLGILVKDGSLKELSGIRTWREMLFVVNGGRLLPSDPLAAAEELAASDLCSLLSLLYKEEAPYYYRIELKCGMDLKTKSEFATKMADSLEKLTDGKMINSPSDYEAELRLMATREGKWFAALRLTGYRDMRFEYRKNTIAASINPSTAALIMELAEPWLREDAQIMDPFCGVGTMLVERCRFLPAREMYGTDIFGQAIELGRENAALAGLRINLIHRDFFDFSHSYPFDEVITDMPVRGKKTREEMDEFCGRFFRKLPEILADQAVIILYTGEGGFIRKQLRLHPEFSLERETSMVTGTATRPGFDLFILKYARKQ